MVRKPSVLPLGKKYIRVDAEVLLVYVHLMTAMGHALNITPARRFEGILELELCNNLLIARRSSILSLLQPSHFLYFHNYLSECSGQQMKSYFGNGIYDHNAKLKLLNGHNIRHPITTPDAYRRGGWVVALGMSHNCGVWPDPLPSTLVPFVSREQLVESPFTTSFKPFQLSANIVKALRCVKDTIEFRLRLAFPGSTEVNAAIDLLHELYQDYRSYEHHGTGSLLQYHMLFQPIRSIATKTDYLKDADAEFCSKIVDMFDSSMDLTEEEKALFERDIPSICRCAAKGVVMIIEFHRVGKYFVEPDLLKRYTHVYFEEELMVE